MLEVFFLSTALAIDAFVVSISLGTKASLSNYSYAHIVRLAILSAFYFGIFQGIMPLFGYLLGHSLLGFITGYASWVACAILMALGSKMLVEAFSDKVDTAFVTFDLPHKQFVSLAIATSIDAMGAGFTLNLLDTSPWIACLLIAFVTAVLSIFGVLIGKRLGKVLGIRLEKVAEVFAGLVLIAIGLKMVL